MSRLQGFFVPTQIFNCKMYANGPFCVNSNSLKYLICTPLTHFLKKHACLLHNRVYFTEDNVFCGAAVIFLLAIFLVFLF